MVLSVLLDSSDEVSSGLLISIFESFGGLFEFIFLAFARFDGGSGDFDLDFHGVNSFFKVLLSFLGIL